MFTFAKFTLKKHLSFVKINLINKHYSYSVKSLKSNVKPPWSVHFYGNDSFSLASLKVLHKAPKSIVHKLDVITSDLKSPIGIYALKNQMNIIKWPLELQQIKNIDIGIVVSFGYLIPTDIIAAYPLGMINVHGSLLPKYRGASPIVHAIANGDTETGVTIMKIKPNKFDVGEILRQEAISISEDVKMPELYKEMAELGAKNLLLTLENLQCDLENAKAQDPSLATLAPKVNPSMGQIDFEEMSVRKIYNLARGLSGEHPLTMLFSNQILKLHNVVGCKEANVSENLGFISFDKKNNVLNVACRDGYLFVDKVQVPKKKIMTAAEFKNGYLKDINKKAAK